MSLESLLSSLSVGAGSPVSSSSSSGGSNTPPSSLSSSGIVPTSSGAGPSSSSSHSVVAAVTTWPPGHSRWTPPTWEPWKYNRSEHDPMEWSTDLVYLWNLVGIQMWEDYPGFGRRLEYEKEMEVEWEIEREETRRGEG